MLTVNDFYYRRETNTTPFHRFLWAARNPYAKATVFRGNKKSTTMTQCLIDSMKEYSSLRMHDLSTQDEIYAGLGRCIRIGDFVGPNSNMYRLAVYFHARRYCLRA